MKLGEIFSGAQLDIEFERLSKMLEEAMDDLKKSADIWAHAEHDYRQRKAIAFLSIEEKVTVDHKKAMVDKVCATEQLSAFIARANRETAIESVRSLRTQMSAFQTLTNAHRDEIAMSALPQRR